MLARVGHELRQGCEEMMAYLRHMDLAGGKLLAPALGMKPPSGLGRWIGYMLRGRFTHEDIAAGPPIPRRGFQPCRGGAVLTPS